MDDHRAQGHRLRAVGAAPGFNAEHPHEKLGPGAGATSTLGAALVWSYTAWTLLYFVHSAMRLGAPGFIFALGAATLVAEGRSEQAPSAAADTALREPAGERHTA